AVPRAKPRGSPHPPGGKEREHFAHAAGEPVVDYGVVEARALLDLEPGDLEPPSDRRRVVAAALLEPLAQRRERRRQQEDEARVRAPLAHLARALQLDLEQDDA